MDFSPELILRDADARRVMHKMKFESDPLKQLEAFLVECNNKNPRYNKDGWAVRFTTPKVMDKTLLALTDDVMTAARALHMVHGEEVLTGDVDWGVAPGGARWAPRDRLCNIATQIIDGKLAAKCGIVAAGSGRVLKPAELAAVASFAPQARTEYDLYCEATEHVLERYPHLNIITVLSPAENSGNDEVIDAVMEAIGGGKGLRFGLVTTRIYQAGLYMDTLRAKARHEWDTFKVAGHCVPPWQKFDRGVLEHYLPELLTTYRKAAIAYHAGC